MFTAQTKIRVRYGETDQMGYLYYGYYAWYYEVGRVEALRELGISYKELEEQGSLLVVAELNAKYLKPAKYDELITVETTIERMPKMGFIQFTCELSNSNKEIINIGTVKLICVDKERRTKKAIPHELIVALKPYFEEKNK